MSCLRVMTLNTAVDSTTPDHPGEARRPELAAWIERERPDVVLLQEVLAAPDGASHASWVAKRVGMQHVFGGRPLRDSEVRFGVAVLSRWRIDTAEHLPMPDSDPVEVPMSALWARTHGLEVVSVHLTADPRQGLLRQRQVAFLDAAIAERRDPTSPLPAVLGGDFNADPDADEIRFLRGHTALDGRTTYWCDAWDAAGPDGSGWTLDPRNPLAAITAVPRRRVDYVFVGDSFRYAWRLGEDGPQRLPTAGTGVVRSARIVCDRSLTGVLASDHYGLLVEIDWPGRPD